MPLLTLIGIGFFCANLAHPSVNIPLISAINTLAYSYHFHCKKYALTDNSTESSTRFSILTHQVKARIPVTVHISYNVQNLLDSKLNMAALCQFAKFSILQ